MSETSKKGPFRYDVVGSFLRPDALKAARAAVAEGTLDAAGLRSVENEEIAKSVDKQIAVGLKAVTDGEFRRRYWHLDFLSELEGVEEVKVDKWLVAFKGHQPKAANIAITGKLGFGNHPFIQDFKEFNEIVGGRAVAKVTIPSPSMLHLMACVRPDSYTPIDLYKDEDTLFQDIAETYRQAVKAFYEAGCRYLQFDDTSWGEFCDPNKREEYAKKGIDLNRLAKKYVDVINYAIADRPDDMTITMHICRGNFRSTWFSSGGYEPVAEVLFGGCNIDGFFLEYDSDRAGGFTPLRYIKNQTVVLGLVTSKFPELEAEADLEARIAEAELYVPKYQLAISPQCGFASTEEGNELTEEDQYAKLALIKRVADRVWGA